MPVSSEVMSRGKVLIIDHRLPTPDRDAGSARVVEIMRALLGRGRRCQLHPG